MIASHGCCIDIAAVQPTPTASRPFTRVSDLLRRAEAQLAAAGVEDARLNAELLLAGVTRVPRGTLRLSPRLDVSSADASRYRTLLERRCSREPLQYILGETEFLGLALEVTPAVLIPRPETELLAEEAIRFLSAFGPREPDVLDIGTGSGNIAIAIARHVPRAHVTAIDSSEEALDVARRNLKRWQIQTVTTERLSVFSDILASRRADLVVSNPPYVPLDEFLKLEPEVRLFEPRHATTDEGDGLLFVRRIADLAPTILRPGGALMLEIGFGQSEAVEHVFRSAGLSAVRILDDLAGIPRIAIGRTGEKK